jgi:DNA (cytosine-5)-methyltransferase 1
MGSNSAMKLDFVDFFSGCGGTSLGMRKAGLNVRLGIDFDSQAAATYKANFKKAAFICADIRELGVDALAGLVKKRRKEPVVFGACAPCQPFSKQNRAAKGSDGRRDLLREFHRFVRAYRPEYLFIENVPGLQSVSDSEAPFSEFLSLLSELKYWHCHRVIMAYHYGVPQRRRRLVLIASRLGPISFPEPTHGPGTKKPNLPTVWERISHLPPIAAGQSHPKIANHQAASLSPKNLERIAATPQGGGRNDWPKRLRLDCHKDFLGHTDVYGRLSKDQPAAALTTKCISLSNGRFGHPVQNRAISIREAACIQTFPMTFKFHGSQNAMAGQIGNAVPVEMAQVFGKAILSHYKKHMDKSTR